jgi:hypothetical protein
MRQWRLLWIPNNKKHDTIVKLKVYHQFVAHDYMWHRTKKTLGYQTSIPETPAMCSKLQATYRRFHNVQVPRDKEYRVTNQQSTTRQRIMLNPLLDRLYLRSNLKHSKL